MSSPNADPGDCSVCGKHYLFLRQHERKIHGILKSSPRRRRVDNGRVNTIVEHLTPPAANTLQPESLIIVKFNPGLATGLGADGSIWICEKVRDGKD